MPRDHHDYSLDKDTPESIQQLLDQDDDVPAKSKNGLPAGDRLDNYLEPDDMLEDTSPGQEAIDIPMYGSGENRALPGEFRSKK